MFSHSIVLLILGAVAHCAPIEIDAETHTEILTPIPILSQSEDNSPDGSFSYSFETGNHIKQEANGYHKTVLVPRLRSDGSKTGELDTSDIIVQSGSYSYISPDGTVISVQWFADENGFQAFGDHLPTPPPIPEPILQALQAQHDQPFDEEPIQQSQDNAVTVPPTESPAQSEIVEKQRQQRSSFLPPLLQ